MTKPTYVIVDPNELHPLSRTHKVILQAEVLDTQTVLEHQIKLLLWGIGEGANDWDTIVDLHRQLIECLKIHKKLTR